VFLIISSHQTTQVNSDDYDETESRPYIDKIVYRVIPDPDTRILALLADAIDIHASSFDPSSYWPVLNVDPDISIHQSLRNGYGSITFNCRMYPLNLTGFRRAFSYAFSKTQVIAELDGFSKEHDSLIPYVNPFCIEDELSPHWYESEVDIGNAILDELNFTRDPTTGVRNAPNGEPFKIEMGYSGTSCNRKVAIIAQKAFENLHVDVIITSYQKSKKSYNPFIDFNLVLREIDFIDYGISWLASEYGSEYAKDININPSGFSNSSFDIWGEQLLHNTTYDDVSQAAAEMQRILQYEVPSIVVYQNYYFQAYRNDKFTNYVEDLDRHIDGYWTMLNIRLLDGTTGGTVSVGIDQKPDSFNFFVAESNLSKVIFDKIHLGLYTRSPDLEPIPQLVEAMVVETSEENTNITQGHTRFTIDLRDDRRWSDNIPVTADDVAFTFNYILESGRYGNPKADDLAELMSVYSPSTYRVILEFCSESYWNFEKFAYQYILPKHAFNGTSFEEWDSWEISILEENQVENINCGPFVLSDFEEGEFYELSVNPDWMRSRWDPYDGMYVARLSPGQDFRSLFQFFTIKWNLNWELIFSHSSESLTTGLDRYIIPCSPAVPFVSYTILLDGEFYLFKSLNPFYPDPFPTEISVHVNDNSLSLGEHNFTIIVHSSYGGDFGSDTVIVTIMLPTFVGVLLAGFSVPFLIFVCYRRINGSNPKG